MKFKKFIAKVLCGVMLLTGCGFEQLYVRAEENSEAVSFDDESLVLNSQEDELVDEEISDEEISDTPDNSVGNNDSENVESDSLDYSSEYLYESDTEEQSEVVDLKEDTDSDIELIEDDELVMAGGTYNAAAAVEYARKYSCSHGGKCGCSYNPAYYNYNNEGGDCANFVSQCLLAGGLTTNSSWGIYESGGKIKGNTAWIQAPALLSYFKNSSEFKNLVVSNPKSSDLKAGNPVWTSSSHVVLCTSDGGGFCGHNNDRKDSHLSSGVYTVRLDLYNSSSTPTSSLYDNPGAPYPIPTRNINNGTSGDDVRWVQKFLNDVRGAGLSIDGVCGSRTQNAVKSFQQSYGLTADGIVGTNTVNKMLEVWRYNVLNPKGCIDSITATAPQTIKIQGWAFDRDDNSKAIDVHVYVGGPAGSSNAEAFSIKANTSRPDVDDYYKVGKNHGIASEIKTTKSGTQDVYVYAINIGFGNDNPCLSHCTINIEKEVLVTKITLDKNNVTADVGDTLSLSASISPSNANNRSVTWSSSDINVATVDSNGKITAKSEGTAIITVTANDGSGKSATCTVTVTKPVTGIALDKSSITLNVDATQTLTATVTPANASDKTLTWSSSDTSVATVDENGKVTAKSVGTATITVTANDGSGKSATCTVTVTQPEQTGWKAEKNKWYYFKSNGELAKSEWLKIGDKWYYFNSDGAMQTGWMKSGNTWYYMSPDGAMQTGWVKLGNTWYYMSPDGSMQTGWVKSGNDWYYMNSNGAMQTGWSNVGGKTYYFDSNGVMASNEWVGGYWLNGDGSWTYKARGSWKHNSIGWWFEDTSGWYAKNEWVTIDGVKYHFDSKGYWIK